MKRVGKLTNGTNRANSTTKQDGAPSGQERGTTAKAAYGVAEWADHSVNFDNGCPHDCAYCYAKSIAVRMKRKTPKSWKASETIEKRVNRSFRKFDGTIMFPTSHDIHRKNLDATIKALHSMLGAGNEVLIVSKPDPHCIKVICDAFEDRKSQILFRFTIGSADDKMLALWEPGAPSFKERIDALRLAHMRGFQTSVSCEPMLDKQIDRVVEAALPFVTDAIWLGRANRLRAMISLNSPGDSTIKAAAERLISEQTDAWLIELHERHRHNPKIKYKDSIKDAVGLRRPTEAGLDI